jgi:hypothetical protein
MVVEQIQGIFNEAMFQEIAALHAAAGLYVRQVSEGFIFPRPLRDLIWRSALRKGHDTLGTILHLVEHKKAGMALPLLRPMCEDLLYLLYIDQLPEATANKIIFLAARREILESLVAQSGGDGNAAWAELGMTGKRPAEELLAIVEAELAKEGMALGWRQGSYWPSAAHVAGKTGMEGIYKKIYHGTSRGVHFSPHHLMRMVWGPPGGPHTARLENFERYYEAYVLTNAGWLFCTLLAECCEQADAQPQDRLNDLVEKLIKTLQDFGNVPIVTSEELMSRPPEPRAES